MVIYRQISTGRILSAIAVWCILAPVPAMAFVPDVPNVVLILADDLGYGDVGCLNPGSRIATPNLDALAHSGMVFTDAHSASAVCTPTRYGLLTGRYCWRGKLQSGVLGGLSPRLIEPERETIASLMRRAGYATACIGKWHLGMDWQLIPGGQINPLGIESREQVFQVDYAQPIVNGPTAVGFDHYFGIAGSLDMVPYAFIKNERITGSLTLDRAFPLRADRPAAMTRKGPAAIGFEPRNVLPALTLAAIEWIADRAREPQQPFFLYLPLASPHTPIAPGPKHAGKTGLGPYADFVAQTDAAVGEVLGALAEHHLDGDTLVIFTSDNGCSPQADIPALRAAAHDPCAGFRGHKADIYEGGHRVPFIVRWPGVVGPQSTTSQLTCLNDVFRTLAEVTQTPVPDNVAEDSFSFLPTLKGTASGTRQTIVHHSINGSFAIRDGDWKLCLCPGSGGWSVPRPGRDNSDKLPASQLFDLSSDPAETTNLIEQHPEIATRLTQLLEKVVNDGRSTPGAPQENAGEVDIWKAGREAMRPAN